ncbi:MAG TPA: DUF3788 domain-containing protein [Thermoanaerobaculia bacterium]|nr:DUF3788 domain-containing protein [Thermoanaerobaculia bacterium]
MALSAFDDKATPPAEAPLRAMLGRTAALWSQLTEDLQKSCGPLAAEWNFAGNAFGWSMRLKKKKRTIVYMTPCRAHFLASFVLGEKACHAARESALPPAVIEAIDGARKYAEGRGVRIPVKTRKDLETIETLAAIKIAN